MLLHESSLALNFFITKHTERLTTLNLDKPVQVMITSELNPPNVKNQPLALSIEHFGNSIIYSKNYLLCAQPYARHPKHIYK